MLGLVWLQIAKAQVGNNAYLGTHSVGMGGVGATFMDINAANANQAGLAYLEGWAVGLNASRRFFNTSLNDLQFGVAIPTKSGTFGLSVNHFGFEAYNYQKIGLAYARKLTKSFSIGAQVDYIGARFGDPYYPALHKVTFELGVLGVFSKKFRLGAHVFSPVQIALTEGDKIPTILKVGACYSPSSHFDFHLDVTKDLMMPFNFSTGLNYKIVKQFGLQAGFQTSPTQFTLGFNADIKSFRLSLATAYHQVLGLSPSIGFIYSAKPSTKK